LLKVDIEGAEIGLFESCPWISNVQVIAIELHDRIRPGCSSVVKNAARDLNCDQRGDVTFFAQQSLDARRYSADLLASKAVVRGSTA
jgi:hypothetical protein